MDPRQLEDFADMRRRYLASLPLEERLDGLKPEERLAGLSEADRVLALPDAALRALPADYLATLPEAAQQRIRERLAR